MNINKKVLSSSLVMLGIMTSLLFTSRRQGSSIKDSDKFAKPGMVAYAASYDTSITSEPQYATQYSKTYQYLSLGNTLNEYRGDSVKVGIIDSGINYDHEDFMVSSVTKVQGSSKYYGWNGSSWEYYMASQHGYSYIDDTLGHGTNVASTVAAAVNGIGGFGLAPNVELYVYKVTNSQNGYEFGAIQNALSDAISLGIKVINMSFQSYENAVSYGASSMSASSGCSTILSYYLNQCHNAGITLVGAAGNYNTDEPSYPGSNNYVINVGSLNDTGTGKAGFSNYGSTIDLVAPGYVYVADKTNNSGYKNTSGTSFSAPLVTAAIALYKQKNPTATPAEIESALYASCDPIDDSGSEYTNWAGNGALNVYKFLGMDEEAGPTEIVINNSEIDDGELSLEVGDELTLDYTVNGNGSFDNSVNFYTLSGEDAVISVSENGVITANGVGEDYVMIESYADSNIYTEVHVTVTQSGGSVTPTVSSVTVTPSQVSLDLNGTKTATLSVTVNGDNNPSQTVTWTSSNTNVATVSGLGVVTAKAVGNATITATSDIDSSKSGTCSVTVSDTTPQTESITITRSSFATAGGYNWYDWSQGSVSGKAELYTTETGSMQFNKSKGNKVAAIFNTTAIPGSITKIEAKTASGTNRTWNAYVTSTSCSASSATLTFGSNKTTVGSNVTISTSLTSLGTSSAGYSYFCLQENESSASYLESIKISYIPKSVSSISAKTAPTKLSYEAGEYFNPTGLVITATYSDSSTADISYAGNTDKFSFSPTLQTALTTSNVKVTITYANRSVDQAITVTTPKVLQSITVSGQTTSFVEGDIFAFGGTVTAHYDDNSSVDVTSSSTFSGYNMTTTGNQTVTVTYQTKSTTYNITVNEGTLSSISISGMTTSYQKNNAFSFDGVCQATFANGYQKNVTPTSVTSPDMSKAGEKTITVTFTYNGVTKTASYDITVNSVRVVTEETETTGYSVIGTVTYPSNTQTVSVNTLSVTSSGYTNIESNAIRLGSSSNTGTMTVTSTTSNITKVVVSAKSYGSDSDVTITIDGTSKSITGSYIDYDKEFATAKNSVAIATTTNKKRAYIQTITVYETKTTKTVTDISNTPDVQGLEAFIDTYMHMDYNSNLGYCNDEEHHYYSSAKAAFNALNEHQRLLFTTNSAYTNEWNRLSTWASIVGDTLNSSNELGSSPISISENINILSDGSLIIAISMISIMAIVGYIFIRRKER